MPIFALADFAAAPTNGYAPLTVYFTNLSSGATNYTWDFGDENSSAAEHPSNTYSNVGSSSVSLTAIGPGGTNSVTRADYIVVTNLPPPVIESAWWDYTSRLVFSGTGGSKGGIYYVLTSTNLVEPITNWVRAATNTFGVGGGFCVTNAVDTSGPPQFFRLRVP